MKYTEEDLDTTFDNIYEYIAKLDAQITVIKEGLTCIVDLLKKENGCQEPVTCAEKKQGKNTLNGAQAAAKHGNKERS